MEEQKDNKIDKGSQSLNNALKKCGISCNAASENILHFVKALPKVTETEIELLKLNPNLSRWQRLKLSRKFRKLMKEHKLRESNT